MTGLLAFTAGGSGLSKLLKVPNVMQAMDHVGLKPIQIPILGLLEIAGALGLILGIWIKPLAILSAFSLLLYFVGAIIAHLRIKDKLIDFAAPVGITIMALATLIFQIQR